MPDDLSPSRDSAQGPENLNGSYDLGLENAGVPDGGRRAWSVLFGV